MADSAAINSAATNIAQAQNIIILMPPSASMDILAAGAGLCKVLSSMEGKSVQLACPEKIESQFIAGLKILETEVGNRNLLISFPYQEAKVDKISYHISDDNKRFYLTIKPKKGTTPLDMTAVEFAYAGFEADLIIYIGVTNMESLAQLYIGYEEQYKNIAAISLTQESMPGMGANLTTEGYSGFSELVLALITAGEWALDSSAAQDLLSGIDSVTDRLRQEDVSPESLAAAAKLIKTGAKRVWKPTKASLKKAPKTLWKGK